MKRKRKWMSSWLLAGVALLMGESVGVRGAEAAYPRFDKPPHDYYGRVARDRFGARTADLENGRVKLDRSNEKAFLRSLLAALEIPESSQMLVFSTTSLQLSRITPANPRALYFGDDVYLGYIPGGRLELAGLDPDLGPIFYIFDIPRAEEPVKVERATRCMNCHAGEETGHVPGLLVKSVVPGPSGGSLDAFRLDESGHGIRWEDRGGGWYVTGAPGWTNHWGNTIGRSIEGVLTRIPNPVESRVDLGRYLVPTSDWLAQAVHEHQVGFVNRAVGLAYRTRSLLDEAGGEPGLTAGQRRVLDQAVEQLVRYMLFVDEKPLPVGVGAGDAAFKEDFARRRRPVGESALRDFELETRLFRNRCSYMIYSAAFTGLPPAARDRVYRRLSTVLRPATGGSDDDYRVIPDDERTRIRSILRGTVPDLPTTW